MKFGFNIPFLLWITLYLAQNIELTLGFTYLNHLECLNENCYDFNQQCKINQTCNITWLQYQKCLKNSNHPEESFMCREKYIQAIENEYLHNLDYCFMQCQGKFIHKCSLQIKDYELCHSNYQCSSADMVEFEKNMQYCLKANEDSYDKKFKQEYSFNKNNLECMKMNANLSVNVQSLVQCQLTNSSIILPYSLATLFALIFFI